MTSPMAVAVAIALGLVALLTTTAAAVPVLLRLVVAISITCLLAAITTRNPRYGLLATLTYLLFLAEIRRLLIPLSDWSSADPLLLVSPAILALALAMLFLFGRRNPVPSGDRLTQLMAAFAVLAVLSIVNPLASGVVAGVGGLFYWAPSLGWYFVARAVIDDRTLERLLTTLVWCGAAIGAFGLTQIFIGKLPWDNVWYEANASLSVTVGDTVKPVGTFSSAFEYATMLAAALCAAVAMALRGRIRAAFAIPILLPALLTCGTRTSLLFAFVGIATIVALNSRSVGRALVIGAIGAAFAIGGMLALTTVASSLLPGNDLAAHSAKGLSDPLNSNNSTFMLHMRIAWKGFKTGIVHPTGLGIGATNQGGAALKGDIAVSRQAEIDIPDAWVALGIPGGLIYIAIVLVALTGAARLYFAGDDLALPALGVLVGGFGQWNTGGHYAMSPLTFVVLAWIARGLTRRAAERRALSRTGPAARRSATAALSPQSTAL